MVAVTSMARQKHPYPKWMEIVVRIGWTESNIDGEKQHKQNMDDDGAKQNNKSLLFNTWIDDRLLATSNS